MTWLSYERERERERLGLGHDSGGVCAMGLGPTPSSIISLALQWPRHAKSYKFVVKSECMQWGGIRKGREGVVVVKKHSESTTEKEEWERDSLPNRIQCVCFCMRKCFALDGSVELQLMWVLLHTVGWV